MLTIHDFPTQQSLFAMLQRVAKESKQSVDQVAQELMKDWRFAAPRLDDVAVACLNPKDPDAALAPDFKEPYRRQWWTRIACDVLDGVYRHLTGQPDGYSRVAIVFPVQHGKSLHVTQLLPAAFLGRLPTLRIGSFGYNQDFAKRSISHAGAIIRSQRFQEIYPGVHVGLHKKIPLKQRLSMEKIMEDTQDAFAISYQGTIEDSLVIPSSRGQGNWRCGGYYKSGSWPTPPNGVGFDLILLDDPYRTWGEVESKAYNQHLWDGYSGTLSKRLQTARSAIIMDFTPWTNDDIFHRVLLQWRQEGHNVKIIKFPAWGREDTEEEIQLKIDRSFDKRKKHVYETDEQGKKIRVEWGDVLDPWKNEVPNAETIPFYEAKKQEPERERYAMFELAPRHQDTDRFSPHVWKKFNPALSSIPLEGILLSLDANAASENQQSTAKHSFAVCGVWCVFNNNFYRLDEYRARPHYSQLLQDMVKLAKKWKGYGTRLLLEEAGHGRALCGDAMFLNHMALEGFEVVATKQEERAGRLPRGWSRMTKEEHWGLIETPINQGRVYLPVASSSPITHEWVNTVYEDGRSIGERLGFIEECQRGGTPNDRLDEMAQAICYLQHYDAGISWFDVACDLGVMDRNFL